MTKQLPTFPILPANGRPFSHTPFGRSVSINNSTDSSRPILLSTARSNFLSPAHLSLKKLKPEPWQRLFEGKKQHDLLMNKNQSTIANLLNENVVRVSSEQSPSDETSQSSFLPTPIQTHIDRLYEQIDYLTVQLSEERFKHKQTRSNANEKLGNQLKKRELRFKELLQQKSFDFQNQLNEQEKKYSQVIEEQRIGNAKREEELHEKLEFLKTAFHVYKINTERDKTEQTERKIIEVSVVGKDRDEEVYNRVNDTVRKERNLMNEKQKMEMENLRKQYQMEMDELRTSLADAADHKKCLESVYEELSATKIELHHSKELTMNLSARLKDLEVQHVKSMRELNGYREHANEKNKEMEKTNSEDIDR